MAEGNDERLYQGPESGDVYSGPQPNTTYSLWNSFSIHSLLRPTRTPQQSHHVSPLLRPTPQQSHRPPPTPDQPVYPPLLQSAHLYTNTGPAYNVTGLSAYPSNTSYPQLPYYRPTASSPFSASQPTHSTQPWFMSQYPHMGMNTNPYTTEAPYPPLFQHPSSYPEYINPPAPTDSLPTGPGPPGLLSGLPVNTSDSEMAEGDTSNHEQLARELHQAVYDEDVGKVNDLLQMNITASHQLYWSDEWNGKWPPLHQGCRDGRLDIVKMLINSGVDVNRGDAVYNSTPLHQACDGGYMDVVNYLIREVGCKVDVRDKYNSTILHDACSGGHLLVVKYLVEEVKCDVDAKDENNWSPLHWACGEGHLDVVEYLVKNANCDVNARDKHNQCPLHLACEMGQTDVVRFLVEKANCGINVTDDRGRTPLYLASEEAIIAYYSEDRRKRYTEIAEYLKSLPTEHSDGQKRVSSENHERRSPPAKQAPSRNVTQAESTHSQSIAKRSGTPLSEEDSDALQRLLQENKVKLPSGQLSFEEVQQLLLDRGLKDLATNLRAELDKVVQEQQRYLKQLENLMTDRDTQNIRYLKTFLVGPPGVGKTTTLNRLLKVITNIHEAGDKAKIPSTLLANCIQVFTFVSGDGTQWIPSGDLSQESILLFRYLCGCKFDIPQEQSCRSLSQQKSNSRPKHFKQKPVEERRSIVNPKAPSKDVTNEDIAYYAHKRSRIHNFVTLLQKLIMNEDHSALLNLLGSTLLNINDVGGQPGFLEMLPALSTGPAMYLVFFDMSKELDEPYKIPFNREDTVITPYDSVHTVEATISQILSAVSSVHCITRDKSQFNIIKAVDFVEKFDSFQQITPLTALIGTHKDHLGEKAELKLESINKSLNKITGRFPKIVSHPSANKCFFAVDNMTGTDQFDVGPIRDFMSKTFQTHFKDATLPIRPKWLWLSLILRREFRIVSTAVCLEIAESLGMDREELDFTLWYLSYCTGTLMYYADIPDDWFKKFIICSTQVVFDSVSQLILASLRSIHSEGCFTEFERKDMIQRGQFSIESIEKYCASYQVKKNLEKFELIPTQQLIKLLNHVNLLSPITHKQIDGTKRITYFMPAVLDSATQDELARLPLVDTNPEPLFITFNCGYVPTGSFCGLITRLVSLGPQKIFGLTWELIEEGVKRNLVSFSVDGAHTVTLLCHIKSYEVRVVLGDQLTSLHDLCTHALSVILYTLHTLFEKLIPQVAFHCPCSLVNPEETDGHLCVLVQKYHIRFICEKFEKCVPLQRNEWLGKCVLSGSFAELEVLKFAEEDFSYHWSKMGSRRKIKTPVVPNVLSFPSVSKSDFGYYLCEVKEAEKVVLTVYRALYIDESNTNRDGFSSSGRRKRSVEIAHSSLEEVGAKRLKTKFSPEVTETMTLRQLSEMYAISIEQLDSEIEDSDMIMLAQYFSGVEYYLSVLELTPAEQDDVRLKKFLEGTQVALCHCLLVWKRRNPSRATLRTLLEILLSLKKEETASNVCKYFCPKHK